MAPKRSLPKPGDMVKILWRDQPVLATVVRRRKGRMLDLKIPTRPDLDVWLRSVGDCGPSGWRYVDG